jgi:hypothetical protein
MNKFSPLDLTAHFNTTRENIPLAPGHPAPWHPCIEKEIRNLPKGAQTFWGIPFSLSDESWLVLGAGANALEINLIPDGQTQDTAPTFILFAHFCNSSYDPNVGTNWRGKINFVMRPGEHLADYILRYADGSEHRQPIRRRFEISEPSNGWGQLAFAARSHEPDRPLDWSGAHPKGCWGANQTGVVQGYDLLSQRFWIYALPNPNPEKPLVRLRLNSTGADTIAVAGITLYYGREHPLRYRRLETLRVTMPHEEELHAAIDLGIVTGVYAIPVFDPDEWLEAEPKGVGEEPVAASPADQHLIDVTACPDATLYIGQHHVEMRDVYNSGKSASDDNQVHIRILVVSL